MALTSGGAVFHWGCILASDLKHNRVCWSPVELKDLGSNIVYISAGPYNCASVNIFGDLHTWGMGEYFRLGHGTCSDEVCYNALLHDQQFYVVDAQIC